jgi:hypothetical protein
MILLWEVLLWYANLCPFAGFRNREEKVDAALKNTKEKVRNHMKVREVEAGVTTPFEIITYYHLNHSIWSLNDNTESSHLVLPGLRSVNHLKTWSGSNVCIKTPTKECPECLTN